MELKLTRTSKILIVLGSLLLLLVPIATYVNYIRVVQKAASPASGPFTIDVNQVLGNPNQTDFNGILMVANLSSIDPASMTYKVRQKKK